MSKTEEQKNIEELRSLQVEHIKERNENRFNDFNLDTLKNLFSSIYYDNRDSNTNKIKEINSDESLSDDEKKEKIQSLLPEYKVSEILSHTLIKFVENISPESLSVLREYLGNAGEKEYSINRKTIALLLQLQPFFKNVPEFQEMHVKMSKSFVSGNKYEKDFIAFIPKQYKKLKDEQIVFITTLFLYSSFQYKYISPNKKDDKEILKETEYDIVFIDFVRSLKGKNINELLKYLHLN